MHLSLLEQCDISIDNLGEVVLQDAFLAWDNKQIIRKGRERRVFLFELYLLFAKEVKDSSGIVKYHFKHKVMTSELGVTEHIEGDECKFAVWTGRAPMLSDYRMVLKANNLETKQIWVKKLREVIQETYFSGASLTLPKSPAKSNNSSKTAASSQRSSKDMDDTLCENDHDGSSLASFGSGNTTDSDKVSSKRHLFAHFRTDFVYGRRNGVGSVGGALRFTTNKWDNWRVRWRIEMLKINSAENCGYGCVR